ncbi:class I SAM-dependent methyltransferase [candidate division WOR-3 bacterium]|nr:class I SAM-dependent methyltransferase [candidate division WOR-3 bacterium]
MEKITLNIGCGERTFKEYPEGYKCINIDERDLSNVDKVMDIRRLEFPDEYFDYILASDIIEHFPISETKDILTEWKRVLKSGGIIEFRIPNLKVICKRYIDGEADTKHTSWLLYGGQSYSGNFHYVGFDKEWFSSICAGCGLKEIEYREEGNNFVMKVMKV